MSAAGSVRGPRPAVGPSRYGAGRDDLVALTAALGAPRYRAAQLWDVLWRRRRPLEDDTTLPAALRAELVARLPLRLAPVTVRTTDAGRTRKWLWSTGDADVETVLMCSTRRASVCVSTQAGCALGCTFCATGQGGLVRNLAADEILEQVMRAQHAGAQRVTHVVFMGMGEPLANWAATREALARLQSDLGISARRLTVSTVGWVPGMRRLAAVPWPVTLAVSLHAPDDALRDELVPVNRRWPLREVLAAAHACAQTRGRRVTFEYTLIAGTNDHPGQARALARLLAPLGPLGRHVNLIPLNPTPAFPGRAPDPPRLQRFAAALADEGLRVTVRRTRGADIDAACGQLRTRVHPPGPARRAGVGKNARDG